MTKISNTNSYGYAFRKPKILAFTMRNKERQKEGAAEVSRPFLYRRQFPPNGMNRVEDQVHSGFAGAFLAADILCH